MKRLPPLLLLMLTIVGCGRAAMPAPVTTLQVAHAHTPTLEERKAAACHAALAPQRGGLVASAEPPDEHRVVRGVQIRDAADRPVAEDLIPSLPVKAGDAWDASHGRDAARRIWSTGKYADVIIDSKPDGDGVAIVFRVAPARTVEHVFTVDASEDDVQSMRVREGATYAPVALYSAARAIEGSYHDRGYLDAKLEIGSAQVGEGRVDVCVAARTGPLVTIASIEFTGTTHEAELRNLLTSEDGKNAPGGILDRDGLDRDSLYMAAKLYDLGYVAQKLAYRTERRGDQLRVVFDVVEGGVYHIGKIELRGDLGAPKAAYERLITFKRGDVFNRSVVGADLDAIRALEKAAGRPDVEITPESNVDPDKRTIDVIVVLHDPHKTTPSAASPGAAAKLQIVEVVPGHGPQAKSGDRVTVHYKGTFPDGTVFDSSISRGQPFVFVLGGKAVIPGFDRGVAGMRVGGKRRVTIPPDLGYGDRGVPPTIPPKSTLIFELELLSVGPP